jgi:predicted dehydrogenase
MLRVAILSKWHVHAKDYARDLKALENVEIKAIWDYDALRGEEWAKELKVDYESDLNSLLQRKDIDAVVVTTPTNMHKEVMIPAARAGKHIFTEKVMALTVEDCREIEREVNKAQVKFCISFPHRCMPHNLFAKKVAEEKLIGDITLLRVRNAHNGSVANWLPEHFYDPVACGGGAMMDLGAHPMYLARWILGKPAQITSMFNSYTDRRVEDNAVSVIEFENKTIAIAETGFVSTNSPFSLELYGTEGSLLVGGPDNEVRLITNKLNKELPGWIKPSQLPAALPNPIKQFVNGILNGTEIPFGFTEGIELTELMEAAYASHKEKKVIKFI